MRRAWWELSLDRLAQQPMDEAGAVHFLKFTDAEDLGPDSRGRRFRLFRRRAKDRKESTRPFRAGRGRLARVGYFSRFVDALYSIALLARGRVPGESAAAASVAYERIMADQERYRYHGRVLRQDGWIVLQYWLFYPFNDWRSGFFGANDHEADWEKIFIYLSESEAGEVSPEWVAYAAHNYTGDNLRRRWDDPEVEKVGEHPVIYVGAGSHASYYAPGEYLTELTLPYLHPSQGWLEPSGLSGRRGSASTWEMARKAVGQATSAYLCGLRARGRLERGERETGLGMSPDSSRTHPRLGLGLPRIVGTLRQGPLRGRGRPRWADVQP